MAIEVVLTTTVAFLTVVETETEPEPDATWGADLRTLPALRSRADMTGREAAAILGRREKGALTTFGLTTATVLEAACVLEPSMMVK